MYASHFKLRENPFSLTPDPKYLFLSRQHREALNYLIYGIKEKKGFIVVTGGIGCLIAVAVTAWKAPTLRKFDDDDLKQANAVLIAAALFWMVVAPTWLRRGVRAEPRGLLVAAGFVVLVPAGLAAVAALYFAIVMPLSGMNSRSAARVEKKAADLAWMQQVAPQVMAASASPSYP